jgi:hypothetical protein
MGLATGRSRAARIRLASLVLLWVGCEPAHPRCELAPPEPIAHHDGLGFDAIAVSSGRDGPLYAWSNRAGLFVSRSAPRRIGERCSGGIDLETSEDRSYVACSRSTLDGDGRVLLYVLDAHLDVQRTHTLGQAGRDPRGVALALRGGQVFVAHHDGAVGAHHIELSTLAQDKVARRRLSREGAIASHPALLVHRQRLYAAFAETRLPDGLRGEARSVIQLARDDEPARAVYESHAAESAPSLAADANGLMLAFRNHRAGESRSELQVARLDDDLRVRGKPRTIGRANSEGAPSVHGCPAWTAALLPREYGSERFLAVNRLDGELASVGAGHQFYTSGRDYVLASGACERGDLLLFAADRAAPMKPGVDAVALRFSCH